MRQLSPFTQKELWGDFDRLFDSFFTGNKETWDKLPAFSPKVDVKETEDYFLISTDLPGVNEKDIHVEINNGILCISGERNFEQEEKNEKFHRVEKSYGKFSRSFQLPDNVDFENVEARNEHGVLEVLIPRKKTEDKKAIKIEAKKGGLFSQVFGKKEDNKKVN
ncbi:MAG: Hsp20/alpha crystallin family protein [Bdellovibrionaceae bacterium]|nr:Hsp20/alpha crystallin family protein [Pseudobdellovibrionaceae bacterium]